MQHSTFLATKLFLAETLVSKLLQHGFNFLDAQKINSGNIELTINKITCDDLIIDSTHVLVNGKVDLKGRYGTSLFSVKFDGINDISIGFNFFSYKGIPQIKLVTFDIQLNKPLRIGGSKINLKPPKALINYLIEDNDWLVQKIENSLNSKLKEVFINLMMNDLSHVFALPPLPNDLVSFLNISAIEMAWNVTLRPNYLILNSNIEGLLSVQSSKENNNNSTFKISDLSKRVNDRNQLVLNIENKHLETALVGLEIKTVRSFKIESVEISTLNENAAIFDIGITGEIEGRVKAKVQLLKQQPIDKIDVQDIEINLSNKILDLGVSLLEEKIADQINVKLNNLIAAEYNRAHDQILDILEENKQYFSINNVEDIFEQQDVSLDFSKGKLDLALDFNQELTVMLLDLPLGMNIKKSVS